MLQIPALLPALSPKPRCQTLVVMGQPFPIADSALDLLIRVAASFPVAHVKRGIRIALRPAVYRLLKSVQSYGKILADIRNRAAKVKRILGEVPGAVDYVVRALKRIIRLDVAADGLRPNSSRQEQGKQYNKLSHNRSSTPVHIIGPYLAQGRGIPDSSLLPYGRRIE